MLQDDPLAMMSHPRTASKGKNITPNIANMGRTEMAAIVSITKAPKRKKGMSPSFTSSIDLRKNARRPAPPRTPSTMPSTMFAKKNPRASRPQVFTSTSMRPSNLVSSTNPTAAKVAARPSRATT